MELTRISNNIYEVTIHGDITSQEIDQLSSTFQEFKERGEKINLLGVYKSFPSLDSLLSVGAVLKMKLRSLSVLQKYAILADEEWIENIIPVANFMTPSMPIRVFDDDDREEALEWLEIEEDKEYDPNEYLTGVDINKLGEYSYSISLDHNKVDHASMAALNEILDDLVPGEKINLLMHFEKFPSIESFKAFFEGLKVDFKILGRLKKYAVVSNAKWIDAYSKIGDFLTPGIEVKAFPSAEIATATKWVIS